MRLSFFVTGIPRYDTVNKGVAVEVLFVVPRLEFFGQVPKLDILIHALFKLVRVVVDKLYGKKIYTVKPCVKSFIKEFRQLRRIGNSVKVLSTNADNFSSTMQS